MPDNLCSDDKPQYENPAIKKRIIIDYAAILTTIFCRKDLMQGFSFAKNMFTGLKNLSPLRQDVLLFDSSTAAQEIAFMLRREWDGCNGVVMPKCDRVTVDTAANLVGAKWCHSGDSSALLIKLSTNELIRRYAVGERNFINANLRCTLLNELNLSKVNLSWAKLSWANLNGTNLSGADLTAADIREANLSQAKLSQTYLVRTNLTKANLWLADLRGADLSQADLREANLSEADLRGANLSLADLRGADLDQVNLSGANLTGAKLTK